MLAVFMFRAFLVLVDLLTLSCGVAKMDGHFKLLDLGPFVDSLFVPRDLLKEDIPFKSATAGNEGSGKPSSSSKSSSSGSSGAKAPTPGEGSSGGAGEGGASQEGGGGGGAGGSGGDDGDDGRKNSKKGEAVEVCGPLCVLYLA